jgi:hypothetical protein
VGHYLPSENKDGSLDFICYPESMVLPDFLSEPVVEAKVLVNQKASHSYTRFGLFQTPCQELESEG